MVGNDFDWMVSDFSICQGQRAGLQPQPGESLNTTLPLKALDSKCMQIFSLPSYIWTTNHYFSITFLRQYCKPSKRQIMRARTSDSSILLNCPWSNKFQSSEGGIFGNHANHQCPIWCHNKVAFLSRWCDLSFNNINHYFCQMKNCPDRCVFLLKNISRYPYGMHWISSKKERMYLPPKMLLHLHQLSLAWEGMYLAHVKQN